MVNESTVRNTTSGMGWWRTNSFGGGEKDGEWSGGPFLGRKGLEGRMCGGVWEREGEGRRGEERGRREKRKGFLSILLFQSLETSAEHPQEIPCGTPCQIPSYHFPHTPLSHLPIQPRPKSGGSPPSSPSGEREEKGGEKRTLEAYKPQFFSLGENPQTPPLYWDAQEKDKKSGGARYVDGPDKIDRSHRDEFNRTVRFNVARLPAEIEGVKVGKFRWGVEGVGVG